MLYNEYVPHVKITIYIQPCPLLIKFMAAELVYGLCSGEGNRQQNTLWFYNTIQ